MRNPECVTGRKHECGMALSCSGGRRAGKKAETDGQRSSEVGGRLQGCSIVTTRGGEIFEMEGGVDQQRRTSSSMKGSSMNGS